MPLFLDLNQSSSSDDGAATPTADWSVRFESGYPKSLDARLADETPFFVDLVVKDAAGTVQDARLLTIQGAMTADPAILPSAGDWQTLPVTQIAGFTPSYRARLALGADTGTLLVRNREYCIHVRATIPGTSGVATLATQKYLVAAR